MSAFAVNPAVMATRAANVIEQDDPQRALWRRLDYYPTPPWATRAGVELIMSLDPLASTAWEPACGAGHMLSCLSVEHDAPGFDCVFASDIHPHGQHHTVHDFLSPKPPLSVRGGVDWVVTNPPFRLGGEFARRGLEVARYGVALLLRLSFLESTSRYDLLFGGKQPVSVVAPFIERVPMQLGSYDPRGNTATAYAWFVWIKGDRAAHPQIRPIPPGTRARLTRLDDARRWAVTAETPLFEGSTS